MGVDLRQVVAGILTITMFVMLGQMIKRDHFDSLQDKLPGEAQDSQFDNANLIENDGLVTLSKRSKGPWIEDSQELKPCWSKTFDEIEQSKGYVTFSLTNGPEYHVSQIADAVVVARYLGANLVLPDIRGSKPGDERKFEDIYDVEKFIISLDGVVKVAKELPSDISIRNLAAVKVPNRVSEDHILENVEPIFKSKGNIRLATYFPTVNMRKTAQKSSVDSVACLGMFGTLELQPQVNEVVESMIERLRTLSRKSGGQFIAVDLMVEILENKNCHGSGSTGAPKSCYNAQEIAVFLRKVGFDTDTTIYLTQSRWDNSLSVLKDIFPKTYTKESIMPEDKKGKFLESEDSEFEKVIDFYICSQSDVFVPAISGLFYANVAGKRIASGKPQILVPADIPGTSAPITNYLSPYVAKNNHLAYSCFC
ncbi:GDP-fucose protein O-fucosyltransferase [Corchorus capsularis]|uniref:O-fucosyltransferase family protein n=1 Tax=Corchorus capsularis TaxID=210143 RepID=A0A1R3I0K1_COCAP|nr:GDP-fucose protein O-fucosyltransferase [Corchorus capsularis]